MTAVDPAPLRATLERGYAGSPMLRAKLDAAGVVPERVDAAEDLLGIETFDIYGLTELWGPGTGIECARHDGIHVWSDHFHVEILDPETLTPVPPGTLGEAVVTTLTKQALPLVRYRTRDLTFSIRSRARAADRTRGSAGWSGAPTTRSRCAG
ncbi:phenylacetate--CoA ligase family protein [Pseudonocardia sp. Cha107L01]|uniref:phenylacetate--CoA ligase family protein n=1 Tax=Pseudonocardia sp. Cha107L01 TaxID=3457576 RepID=UPI00403EAB07